MAGSTTTTLNDLLPAITAEAMFVASERSIMRGLVKNYSIPAGQGKTITVPRYPIQSAAAVTEGDEVTNTAVSTDGVTLTVSTVGIRTLLTDLARTSAASNVVADLGKLFGEAIARKIDQDLTALFSGFSNVYGNVSAASSAITAADIFKAVALLRSGGVPPTDLVCVLNPMIAYDLKKDLTNTYQNPNAGVVQNEAMASGYVGMLAGVPIYETSNVLNNGTTGDYVGAVFHREALGLAMIGDINIESQRRASYIGDDIVASAHYAAGELYDGYGVALGFDSSIQ